MVHSGKNHKGKNIFEIPHKRRILMNLHTHMDEGTEDDVTCSKTVDGGRSFFSSFLDNRDMNILGTGDTRALTGEK